jgi:hypothetical protein
MNKYLPKRDKHFNLSLQTVNRVTLLGKNVFSMIILKEQATGQNFILCQ